MAHPNPSKQREQPNWLLPITPKLLLSVFFAVTMKRDASEALAWPNFMHVPSSLWTGYPRVFPSFGSCCQTHARVLTLKYPSDLKELQFPSLFPPFDCSLGGDTSNIDFCMFLSIWSCASTRYCLQASQGKSYFMFFIIPLIAYRAYKQCVPTEFMFSGKNYQNTLLFDNRD